MSEGISIELLPGESPLDAIHRLAAEQAAEKPKKAPKPKKVTVSDPTTGSPVEPETSGAFHVYRQGEMPDGVVRSVGTRYRGEFGPSVHVYVHLHHFGEECTPACKERVLDA